MSLSVPKFRAQHLSLEFFMAVNRNFCKDRFQEPRLLANRNICLLYVFGYELAISTRHSEQICWVGGWVSWLMVWCSRHSSISLRKSALSRRKCRNVSTSIRTSTSYRQLNMSWVRNIYIWFNLMFGYSNVVYWIKKYKQISTALMSFLCLLWSTLSESYLLHSTLTPLNYRYRY